VAAAKGCVRPRGRRTAGVKEPASNNLAQFNKSPDGAFAISGVPNEHRLAVS
jgi:hypothetical protein